MVGEKYGQTEGQIIGLPAINNQKCGHLFSSQYVGFISTFLFLHFSLSTAQGILCSEKLHILYDTFFKQSFIALFPFHSRTMVQGEKVAKKKTEQASGQGKPH